MSPFLIKLLLDYIDKTMDGGKKQCEEELPTLNYDRGFSNIETLHNETKLYVAT